MQCANCNSFLRPNAKICVSCGCLVNASEATVSKSDSELALDRLPYADIVNDESAEDKTGFNEFACEGCGRILDEDSLCESCNSQQNEIDSNNEVADVEDTATFNQSAFEVPQLINANKSNSLPMILLGAILIGITTIYIAFSLHEKSKEANLNAEIQREQAQNLLIQAETERKRIEEKQLLIQQEKADAENAKLEAETIKAEQLKIAEEEKIRKLAEDQQKKIDALEKSRQESELKAKQEKEVSAKKSAEIERLRSMNANKNKQEIKVTDANGNTYTGEVKDGKRNGKGTFVFSDGGKYVGDFKNGIMEGQGTLTDAQGNLYVGDFKNGKIEGNGVFTDANQIKYIGVFKDNKFVNGRTERPQSTQENAQIDSQPSPQDVNGKFKAKFKGFLGIKVATRYYQTEEMKNEALRLWKAEGKILEPDGTITTLKSENQAADSIIN